MNKALTDYLTELPLIAILRGLQPEQALATADVLVQAGFVIIEVPLNSPQPFDSIERLAKEYGERVLIGAGTVMTTDDVSRLHDAGGQLVVMPHFDEDVVTAAKQYGLLCTPGVATPSEAFAALRANADGLKVFPAEMVTPTVIKAWRAVLPNDQPLLPVGGITPDNMAAYWQAGANGFGLGSALFKASSTLAEITTNAQRFRQSIESLRI